MSTELRHVHMLQNSGGWTALHEAAVNGQAEVIQQLVALGASVADRTREGDTALHKAARWGHAHIVRLLLLLGSNVNAVDTVSPGLLAPVLCCSSTLSCCWPAISAALAASLTILVPS